MGDLKEPTRWKGKGSAFWVGRTSHAKALGQEQACHLFQSKLAIDFRDGKKAIMFVVL